MMIGPDVRIAVCIPNYNRLEKLKVALSSLTEQSEIFDIHVFDDCSAEPVAEYVEGISKKYSNVFYHRSSNNIGYVNNVNRCLSVAVNYDWIGILHNDDFYNKDIIGPIKKMVSQYPDAGFIFSDCDFITADNRIRSIKPGKLKVFKKGNSAILASLSFVPCSTTFYSSKAIAAVGLFSADFPFSADEEYNSRIASAYDVIKVPFCIATIRIDGENYRYETWCKNGFMENYLEMRQKMLSNLILPSKVRNNLVTQHIAKTCVFIYKELKGKGYKNEANTYRRFFRTYKMPLHLRLLFGAKLLLFRLS